MTPADILRIETFFEAIASEISQYSINSAERTSLLKLLKFIQAHSAIGISISNCAPKSQDIGLERVDQALRDEGYFAAVTCTLTESYPYAEQGLAVTRLQLKEFVKLAHNMLEEDELQS